MRELLLLRHAKSDWTTGVDDINRPLQKRGELDAHRIGTWLLNEELIPDYIVCSPAKRAQDTACFVCNTMSIPCHYIVLDRRLYEASAEQLLKVIKKFSVTVKRVLLVGHNPGMEDLLQNLVANPITLAQNEKLLTTATLARVKIPHGWHSLTSGQAKLISITRPKSLPRRFPYPFPNGEILRKRPAYYYTQSAVIPYRINNGNIEILLITTTKKNRWIIPKGIVEPGMSAPISAEKEAYEEAGVRGKLSEICIGSYSYNKWQAECEVHVYPLEVTHANSDKNWQERHRERGWFSVEQAADKLQQSELVTIINNLVRMLKDK